MNRDPADQAPATSARAPAHAPAPRERSGGLRYGLLFGPGVLGVTAAGIALPEVASALGASASSAAWVLTAYALALAVGTALFGRLADSRGIRASLLSGSLVLAAGAAICLAAPGLEVLVAGRFVLAAGSGAMISCALALAAATAPAHRAAAIAGIGATMAVFSACATLMGGVLTQWVTWRLTLVMPALSLVAVPLCLRAATARRGSGRSLDVPGAALLTLAATAFLLLIQSSGLGLTAPVTTALAAALLLTLLALVRRVRTADASFVPRALITDAAFLRAAVTGIGVYAGLFAAMYAVPQILARDHGWSVLAIGAWLLPGAVAGAVLSRVAGRLAAGPGATRLLTATALTTALALGASLGGTGPAQLVTGASLGFAGTAITQVVTTALMSARVEPALRGGAMGLLNLCFFLGGGVGSATAGALAPQLTLPAALGAVAVFPLAAGLMALTLAPPRRRPRGVYRR
ncbi:MFS transporter [Streptomyces sp. NPDC001889]